MMLTYIHIDRGSLSKDAVRYVLEYITKDRNYLNDLKTCEIAEEFFFQTI